MVLKTLQALGPLHGYGIARRIEQTSRRPAGRNYGTLYPALLKLEQEGYICSEWGTSDNNRKAKYYKLTRAGRKQLEKEARDWEQTTEILARFPRARKGIRMRSLRALLLQVGGLFRKAQYDADLSCELESHLRMHIEENLRAGMRPEEARRQR